MRLLPERREKLFTKKKDTQSHALFRPKPLILKYVYQILLKEWDETVLVSNKFNEIGIQ